jgi:Protein of unknown function (DUF3237)
MHPVKRPAPSPLDIYPPSNFRVATKAAPVAAMSAAPLATQMGRFAPGLRFLAAVTVTFAPIQLVGETPDGVRFDFLVRLGTVDGPALRGKVTPGSSDHMVIRPDGIGEIRVRAAIVAHDGARFEIDEKGTVDFGEDGYKRALANDLPAHSPLVICPRFLTGHRKYQWLNRLQCLGIGWTRLDQAKIDYSLFALTSRGRLSQAG